MSNRKLEDDGILRSLLYGREFLSDESRWCKGTAWRDKDGNEIENQKQAIRENVHTACVLGAVALGAVICDENGARGAVYIDRYWINRIGLPAGGAAAALSYWNDHIATHKDILEFLDETIEHRKTELLEKVGIAE